MFQEGLYMEMKKSLLKDLLQITKDQARSLKDNDHEKFYHLLNVRQKILAKYLKQLAISPDLDDECKALKNQISDIHEHNTQKLTDNLTHVKKELRRIRASRNNTNKYKNVYKSTYEGGLFFDKRNG